MNNVVSVGNLALKTETNGKEKNCCFAGPSYYCALMASKLGYSPTIVSKISSNFSKDFESDLKKNGIELLKQPTWQDLNYCVDCKKGEEKAIVGSDAGPIITVPKMDVRAAFIGSYFGHIGLEVLKNLKSENNIIALDAQGFIRYKEPDGKISLVPWLEKEEYLKHVDILKLNINELFYLTGKTTMNSAQELLKLGPKIVIVTASQGGAYVFKDKSFVKVPVYDTKVVSRSCCGSVFLASFALRYLETNDALNASYFASAASSFSVEKEGIKGIASKEKVEARYKTLREIFLV